ncbi:ABC-type transport auxiliary lipoprotein family protein [Microvirga sp. W0021]|uniref:ABC-type transport auxiliary lipoprotein family protein n=1 Tax=Hohaiivirga grylli TaxID=3133970 RepID=A0ABV0BKC2_9HYPH
MTKKPSFQKKVLSCSRLAKTGLVSVILVGLAACGTGPAPTTYDLSAPTTGIKARLGGQIVIATPTALQALSDQNIVVRNETGAMTFLGGGQWADQLPNLIQARLINTFENGSKLRAVALPSSGVIADYQLVSDVRAFYVVTPGNEAVVELSVRLVNARTGQIIRGKVFTAKRQVGDGLNAGSAAVALNDALSSVLLEIARWVG